MIDFSVLKDTNRILGEVISGKYDQQEIEGLLRERARRLSERRAQSVQREVLDTVVVARRNESAFGFPVHSVREVQLVEPEPIPHATAVVVGSFQVRGQLRCLIDMQPLISRAGPQRNEPIGLAVTVTGPPGEVSVGVDEIIGTRIVYRDEIADDLANRSASFISAVTKDLLSIVDVQELLLCPEVLLDVAIALQA
jgi:chemotaxis signal transduction protein